MLLRNADVFVIVDLWIYLNLFTVISDMGQVDAHIFLNRTHTLMHILNYQWNVLIWTMMIYISSMKSPQNLHNILPRTSPNHMKEFRKKISFSSFAKAQQHSISLELWLMTSCVYGKSTNIYLYSLQFVYVWVLGGVRVTNKWPQLIQWWRGVKLSASHSPFFSLTACNQTAIGTGDKDRLRFSFHFMLPLYCIPTGHTGQPA